MIRFIPDIRTISTQGLESMNQEKEPSTREGRGPFVLEYSETLWYEGGSDERGVPN